MKYRLIVLLFTVSLVLSVGIASAESDEGSPISFHGYGEMHYNNPEVGSTVPDPDDPSVMDFHRMVLGWSVAFNDRMRLHAEVDFEHAATEIELEFAYLEFDLLEGLQVRAGSLLMPVGNLNEFHEPTLFYSVERPYVQAYIIPTTWQEGGAGIAGGLPVGLRYRLYYVTGLDAKGFSGAKGIRDGRVALTEDKKIAEKMAVVGRLEYVGLPGVQFGASYYQGGANQLVTTPNVDVSILEADLSAKLGGVELRGLYTTVNVNGADELSTALADVIGEKMTGMNAEVALHVLPWLMQGTEQDLVFFGRWEQFNTQDEVPSGLTADDANDRTVVTYGVAYFPHRDVAIKIDQERWKDKADNIEKRVNAGLAYMF
jgi:hypothetical protein